MAIAIRGTTPATASTNSNPVTLTLNGARQPQTGDVLLIIHANDFYDLADMVTPTVGGSTTGVVAVTNGTADEGSNLAHAKSYTYVVGSTGDLVVEETELADANEEKGLIVYVLTGVDNGTPLDIAGNGTGDSVSQVAPSISPISTDAYLICHTGSGAGNSAGSYTPPSGMAETCDFDLGGAWTVGGAALQLSASGATGTKTFTAASQTHYAALSIALKTAEGAGPPPDLEEGPQVNVTRSNNRFA